MTHANEFLQIAQLIEKDVLKLQVVKPQTLREDVRQEQVKCIQTVTAKGATEIRSLLHVLMLTTQVMMNFIQQNQIVLQITKRMYSIQLFAHHTLKTNVSQKGWMIKQGITSTGMRQYQQFIQRQQCADQTFISELECSSRLKACTSDGNKCLMKADCISYITSAACNVAGHFKGVFFWVAADYEGSYRAKVCADIPNLTTIHTCKKNSKMHFKWNLLYCQIQLFNIYLKYCLQFQRN